MCQRFPILSRIDDNPFDPNPYRELDPSRVFEDKFHGVKTFTLPVSGSVVLFGPEIRVIDTPEFQRLSGVKQLGTSYVVYRGARHTRFEHSLGSLHQAQLMIEAIRRNPRHHYTVELPAVRLARLGALLHDLPHVPFGHTLEDEFNLLKRHDENEWRLQTLLLESSIGEILRQDLPAGEFDQLVAVLQAKKDQDFAALRYPFVGDIVGNTVCADLLDYVPRDLLACGLPAAVGERFLDYLSVTSDDEGPLIQGNDRVERRTDAARLVLHLDKRGMPRPDVESEVVKLLTYRYELAERVYFHHSKNAASVMIGRAVQEAGWAVGETTAPELEANFLGLSDDLLLAALAERRIERALGLQSADVGNRRLASELASGVQAHRLYKIAYLATWDDIPDAVRRIANTYKAPERRRELEDSFARRAGVASGRVLVHIPRQKMMHKDADVRVRTTRGEVVKLHEWDRGHSQRLAALNEAHDRLWRVTVYLHPDELAARALVQAAATDEFRAPSRYVPPPELTAYDNAVFDNVGMLWELDVADRAALSSGPYEHGGEELRTSAAAQIAAIRERRKRLRLPAIRRRPKQ